MTEVNEPGAPATQPAVVDQDIPCRKCAYNLRGLSIAGKCPECGTDVALSARGHLIRYSDPQWVGGLSKGVRLILWALVLMILSALGGALLASVMGPSAGVLSELSGFVAMLLGFWGSWLLSGPDPSTLGEAEYGTARRVLRATLLVGLVGAALNLGQGASFLPPLLARILMGIGVVLTLADAIGYFAQLHYLQHLLLRIPEVTLSKRAGFLKYGIGLTYGLVVALGAVETLLIAPLMKTTTATLLMSIGCAAAISGVLLIVFSVMYLFLLLRLNKRLKLELQAARGLWAEHGAAQPPR